MQPRHAQPRFSFGPFELDSERGLLVRDGAAQPIAPKPWAMLLHLIESRERVVSREELLEVLWPGVTVSEAALASVVRDLRRALGDEGGSPRFVATLRGRGYRFVHEVEAAAGEGAEFVGRRGPLDRGQRAVEAAANGRGTALFICGEAGVGKTRTALEIARQAVERGFERHIGRSSEDQGAPPYWPWLQVLRSLGGSADAKRVRDLIESEPPDRSDAEIARRFQILDALAGCLIDAARCRPQVIVLDDLQRADSASLRALRHLLGEIAEARVLVVGTFRDVEIGEGHLLAEVLAHAHPTGERIALRGLDTGEIERLVEMHMGRAPTPGLAEVLYARTRGNPLFVLEIVRSLEDDAACDAPDLAARAEVASPAGARALVRARVDALPAPGDSVLEAAAVLGYELDLDVLVETCPDHESAVRAAVDAAIAAELLIEPGPAHGRLAFAHDLVRDVLYDQLPSSRRARLHDAAGEALERLRAADLELHVAELAHHFGRAGSASAARYARWAGERALREAAYHEATQLFESELRAHSLHDAALAASNAEALRSVRAERAAGLVRLGQARWGAGETDRAREAFEGAVTLAREIESPELLARAALGYAGRTDVTPGVNRRAVALLEEALSQLPSGDSALRAELLARSGTELYYDADASRSRELTEQAVAMADRLAEPRIRAYALSALGFARNRPEVDPREIVEIAEEQVTVAASIDDLDTLALGRQVQVAALLALGEVAALDECLRSHGEAVTARRQPFFRWMYSVFLGMRSLLAGRLDEAERRAEESFAQGLRLETPNAIAVYGAQLFCIRRDQQRLAELVPLLEQIGTQGSYPTSFRAGLAAAYAAYGRSGDAAFALEQVAAPDFSDLPRDQHFLETLGTLTPACVAIGEESRARRIHGLLAPFAGRLIPVGFASACHGAVDHHLALVSAAFGDPEQAEAEYEAALAVYRRADARLFAANAQLELASVLWKRGRGADRERAYALSDTASHSFAALGLPEHRRPDFAR